MGEGFGFLGKDMNEQVLHFLLNLGQHDGIDIVHKK